MLGVLNQDQSPFFSNSVIPTIIKEKLNVCKVMFGVQERGASYRILVLNDGILAAKIWHVFLFLDSRVYWSSSAQCLPH